MDNFTALLVVEVGLPTSMNIYCFLCLVCRCIKIMNAGLLYNTSIPARINLKQVVLGLWLLLTLGQLVLMNLKNKDNHYRWMQYARVTRFKNEAAEFGDRIVFFGSLCFQTVVIGLYIYTLRLEGRSKINSLSLYTVWYFIPMAVLYFINGVLIYFYFPPELVVFV